MASKYVALAGRPDEYYQEQGTHARTDLDKLQNFQKVPSGAISRQGKTLGQGLGPPCALPGGLLESQYLCCLHCKCRCHCYIVLLVHVPW